PNPQQIQHCNEEQGQSCTKDPYASRVVAWHEPAFDDREEEQGTGKNSIDMPHRCTLSKRLRPSTLMSLTVKPSTENGTANAYTAGPFLNRYFKVMRHAHRKHFHLYGRQGPRRNQIAQLAHPSEERSGTLGILRKRRHCHQPMHRNMIKARRSQENVLDFARSR